MAPKVAAGGGTTIAGWNRVVARSWLAAVACGLFFIVLYGFSTAGSHLRYVSVGLLTGGAAALAGTLLGVLFGIPKYVSSGKSRARREMGVASGTEPNAAAATDETGEPWTPSTNLAEVSDWLLKLLLGAGLVELTHLGGPLGRLVRAVGAGLDEPLPNGQPSGTAVVAAGTILVLFLILGFLMGYMMTTLWYRHVLNEDDGDSAGPLVAGTDADGTATLTPDGTGGVDGAADPEQPALGRAVTP